MMNSEAQKIIENYNKVYIDRNDLNRICKDRLDFGFDSIYFRYSELVEELSWFKQDEARRNGKLSFDRKNWCDTRRKHFYECLEQLTQAHKLEDDI